MVMDIVFPQRTYPLPNNVKLKTYKSTLQAILIRHAKKKKKKRKKEMTKLPEPTQYELEAGG